MTETSYYGEFELAEKKLNGEKSIDVFNVDGDLVHTFTGAGWTLELATDALIDLRAAYERGYRAGKAGTQAKIRRSLGIE